MRMQNAGINFGYETEFNPECRKGWIELSDTVLFSKLGISNLGMSCGNTIHMEASRGLWRGGRACDVVQRRKKILSRKFKILCMRWKSLSSGEDHQSVKLLLTNVFKLELLLTNVSFWRVRTLHTKVRKMIIDNSN